jgi:DNA-3-methyladenine glycosylase II
VSKRLASDLVLGPVVARHGPLEVQAAEDAFERLVVSIVSQQLSTASAGAIRARLFERFEISPRALMTADPAALAAAGLSGRKIEYIKGIAETFERDGLTMETFAAMSDEEVIDRLTSIRGVGVWTAKMFLMFGLGRPDVFPTEDLGIRKGMERLYGEISVEEMVEVAEAWRPDRTLACLYLWCAHEEPS